MSEQQEQYQVEKATTTSQPNALMVFDKEGANHLYRLAKTMSESSLVPKHFQGKPSDCFLAVEMAQRLRIAPFMVLQNLYVVHGRPGWSSQFLIAMANRSGTFKGTIMFEEFGLDDDLEVAAYAFHADNGQRVEAKVSMKMARSEGWTQNNKYKTMPVQMLRYRAASFLVRTYCPEVTMGIPTSYEIETIPAHDVKAGRPVYDTEAIEDARTEQLNGALAAAKAAGVPDDAINDNMTSVDVYELVRQYKAQKAEEAAASTEKDDIPMEDKPKEKPAQSKKPTTKAATAESREAHLAQVADKMTKPKLAEKVKAYIADMSAVMISAYGKMIGIPIDKGTDFAEMDKDMLKTLYVAIMIEVNNAEKAEELSFA